jgi:hypothetical protein
MGVIEDLLGIADRAVAAASVVLDDVPEWPELHHELIEHDAESARVAANLVGVIGARRVRAARTEDPIAQARRAVDSGDLDEAARRAEALLVAATGERGSWNEGNLVHHGHLVLGHVALRRGDLDEAARRLVAAGRAGGSPQLDSFGPNMGLAKALLEAGRVEAVVEFFDGCASFWDEKFSQLPEWRAAALAGIVPNFRANLVY